MAFANNRFVRQTVAFNSGQITTTLNPASAEVLVNGPAWFTYASADDAIATIAAANYFAPVVQDLAVNDRIDITGSDASGIYIVSAVDKDAETVSIVSYSASAPVGTANIEDDAVTTAKIADNAVTAAKIADLEITNSDVSATAGIVFSKLEDLTSTNIIVGSSTNVPTQRTVTGDIAISNTGVTSISTGVIVNADVSASAAIAFSKMEDVTSGEIIVGSAGNVPTAVAMSGDVAIAASGATTIQAGAVESSMVEEGLLRHAQVDIALADFIGSNTASVVLVAAPGANKKIVLHRATLWVDYGGTVLANGGTVQLQYADTANAGGTFATGTIAAATLIAATADTTFGFSPVDTTLVDSATLNEGLYLSTATADFTGGTSSAYKVDLWYSVMNVA